MTRLWFERALLSDGWAKSVLVIVSNGKIASIDTDVESGPNDECHAIALPGQGNVHSHAFQRAMAGLTERRHDHEDSFWGWREVMYQFTERLSPDDLRAIASLAYMEMLEAGFTRVGEFHYLHHDIHGHAYDDIGQMAAAIIEAAKDTGIGMTLLPVFYAHSGFGGIAPQMGQRRFINSIDSYGRLHERCVSLARDYADARVGIAPHSLRAVTEDELGQIIPLAQDQPIHIHIAEQRKEVEDCLQFCGQRPIEWLSDHFDLSSQWCLVHATHATTAERHTIAKSSAVVGLCPITEANLGDGIFELDDFLRSGGRYGIGSDSNVLISMTEELRLLEYGQRLSLQKRNVSAFGHASSGRSLYEAALQGAALSLGVENGLKVGVAADVISLNPTHRSLFNKTDDLILDSLIFAAATSPIDCVWRYGRKVVKDGIHVSRDQITKSYGQVIKALCA